MQKKNLQKFIIIALLTSFACAKNKDPYALSHLLQIQLLEKKDHKLCVNLKLTFDKKSNMHSKLYWRCRLSFAKYRLSPNPRTEKQKKRNLEINDLITKISLKIIDASEPLISQENKKMDNRHHKQCLVMGFVVKTEDQAKADEYFSCRKALIEDQQLIPPYGNVDYLKYQNYSYNIGFVINRRIEEALKLYKKMKEKYPTCIKYHLYGINFKRCTVAQDRMRKCMTEINRKKFKRNGEEKIACQKESYIRFSDKMLKEDSLRKKEIKERNSTSDYYNKQSFASIGLNKNLFSSKSKKSEKEKKKERMGHIKKINSKSNLYNKHELTKLRQRYIFSCQKNSEKRVERFVEGLTNYCKKLESFELVGDE